MANAVVPGQARAGLARLCWQVPTASRLIARRGEIVTVYHDIDKSRSLPWGRPPARRAACPSVGAAILRPSG
jgi:hypothetical protein